MSEDMTLEMMVDAGYIERSKKAKNLWSLTKKGRVAFQKLVESDPKFYAREFPDWIKIDWVN